LFYIHKPFEDGVVAEAYFSQWFTMLSKIDGIPYPKAKQWRLRKRPGYFVMNKYGMQLKKIPIAVLQ